MQDTFYGITDQHNQARHWVAEQRGTYVTQQQLKAVAPQLNVDHLITSAKGIYKPAHSQYAFSIRREPTGRYSDHKPEEVDGMWALTYDAEIDSRNGGYANASTSGLLKCLKDRLPVAVFWRHEALQPYEILGLGRVTDFHAGQFCLFGPVDGSETVTNEAVTMISRIAHTDSPTVGLRRLEQSVLRARLLNGAAYGHCRLCQIMLPAELLVAAHIKPRNLCTESERLDAHVATLMCVLGCDALFERGYLRVMDSGKVYRMVGEDSNLEPIKVKLGLYAESKVNFNSAQERTFFQFHRDSFTT